MYYAMLCCVIDTFLALMKLERPIFCKTIHLHIRSKQENQSQAKLVTIYTLMEAVQLMVDAKIKTAIYTYLV